MATQTSMATDDRVPHPGEPRIPSGAGHDGAAHIPELVLAGTCPWCGRTGLIRPARHTTSAHGVDRRRLRELMGVTWTTSICAPEDSARRRELNARPERLARWERSPERTGARDISPVVRERSRELAASIIHRPGRPHPLSSNDEARIIAMHRSVQPWWR
jgi:hypothetical protein